MLRLRNFWTPEVWSLTHLFPYAVLLRKSGVLGAQPLAWPMWGNAPFKKMKMIEETCGFLTRPNLASLDL